jgi:photosystem II stability/assembly factor-like uncharacterized protein
MKLMNKRPLSILLMFAAIICAPSASQALTWPQNTYTDFSTGLFTRTTSTVALPEIRIGQLSNWYNSQWDKRKPVAITLDNTIANQYIKHQVKLTVDTKNLYAAGRMRADGADLRFTDEDGVTLLPYWISISTNELITTTTTEIWVKISSITANVTKNVYMYYDNASTGTSLSNVHAVYDLYEDWNSGVIDNGKWILGGDANFQIVSSSKYEGGYSVRSGAITHSQQSYIQTVFYLDAPADITFYWASSCQSTYDTDRLMLQINGSEFHLGGDRVWGETPWVQKTVVNYNGVSNTTLTWQYHKDSIITEGLDYTWLDKITVLKRGPTPTLDYTAAEEFFGQRIYLAGRYSSEVFNAIGPNSTLKKVIWGEQKPAGTSVNISIKYSPTNFDKNTSDSSLAPQAVLNGADLAYQGQYFQLIVDLGSDVGGTTSPTLLNASLLFDAMPARPTQIRGTAISSSSINWEWLDNSGNELGFKLFSSTKTFPAGTGFISDSSTVDGMLAAIAANATYYIETGLPPNTSVGRFVVANSTNGANVNVNPLDLTFSPVYLYTLAQPPQMNSERFMWDLNDPIGDPFDSFHYEAIPLNSFSSSATHYFTSNLFSTGSLTAEYYRVVWDTNPAHTWLNNETLWAAPTNFVFNQVTLNTATGKPQIYKLLTFNTTSAYLHVRSYNATHLPSGDQDVGPFFFNGCPSQITDLTAAASTTQEGAIKLTWSAPTAFSTFTALSGGQYLVRWGPTIITSDNSFDNAPYGTIIQTTTVSGSLQSLTITGLTPGANYGFAVKAVNSQGNSGKLSTNITDILKTFKPSAKVSKIVFTTPAPTTYVGLATPAQVIRCEDASGNPLKLFANQVINITLDGELLTSPDRGYSEILSPWSPTYSVQIPQGSYTGQFYYKDNTAGNHIINVSNSDGAQGWADDSRTATILPGKAVTFVIDATTSQDIGNHAQITARANDGYNSSNTSQDFIGSVVATVTVNNSVLTPSNYSYVSSDAGSKVFDWVNPDTAGQGSFVVTESNQQYYTDVKFIDTLNAFALTNVGMLKRTVDGGSNWFSLNSTGTSVQPFTAVTFDASNNYVLASGKSGIVLVSTDAAQTIGEVDTGIGENLNDIFFVDVSTVYSCANNGKIVKSTDSGAHWSANIGPGAETNNFNSIYFVNDSTGFVAGNGGKVYGTTDGGKNWSALTAPAGNPNILKIQFFDQLTGFASCAAGKVFKTADGGSSWVDISPGVDTDLTGMSFFDSNKGYVAGRYRTLMRTNNGGTNWTRMLSSTTALDLHAVSFAASDPSTVVAVGDNITVYRTADSGTNWNQIQMQGQSSTINWNGLIVTSTSSVQRLLQGRDKQLAIKIMARTLFGGSSTISAFRVTLSGGTGTESDIKYVRFYRDTNNNGNFESSTDVQLGSPAVMSGGAATVSPFSNTITNAATFFMVLDIEPTATIGNTLGFQLNTNCLTVSSGKKLARNGLPATIPPVEIQPSSCTLNMNVSDLSGNQTEVTQGQAGVLISSFSMITDRSFTIWRRLIVRRNGINNNDSSVSEIKLWKSENGALDGSSIIIGTATFGSVAGGLAYIDIFNPLMNGGAEAPDGTSGVNSETTSYFFLTLDVSPNAVPYTTSTDARFWFSFDLDTAYFLLDNEGANGINPNIGSYESAHLRIRQAFDTLLMSANNPPVGITVRQSDTASFIPVKLQRAATGGSITWIGLSVAQKGTAADSDIDSVSVYRDSNGNNSLNTATDALLGSAGFVSGLAQISLNNPEDLTSTLSDFATYFVAVSVYKRATESKTVQLEVSSMSFSMAGTDIVDGPTLTSPVAVINNYPDRVTCRFENIIPREARIDELNVAVSKMTLWARCSASLTLIAPQLTGTGSYTDITAVKVYGTTDNGSSFDPVADTLLGSGAFGSDGKAPINITIPPVIYDSSYTIFLAYDLNSSGTPDKTVGFLLSDSQDTVSFPAEYGIPGEDGNSGFGTYTSGTMKMLRKETPSIPQLTLGIGWPSGRRVNNRTVYYSNDPAALTFNSEASALNGVSETKYGLASFDVIAATETPDVIAWQSTAISTGTFSNLNLQHNTTYYLWVKAVSTDGYERVTSAMILVDLMPPAKPTPPTDTSPKTQNAKGFMAMAQAASVSSSYWVNWAQADGSVSGVLYYELQERADTSPLWQAVSTTTALSYMISKDTYTDQGRFFYYRVRAKNYAGTWGPYSDASVAAYLSLPTDLFKDFASYPNPFDSRTKTATITFVLNQQATIDFRIYTLLGGLIKQWTYVGQMGPNNLSWDGTDDNGNKVAAGMYILNADVKTDSDSQKKRWKIGVIH